MRSHRQPSVVVGFTDYVELHVKCLPVGYLEAIFSHHNGHPLPNFLGIIIRDQAECSHEQRVEHGRSPFYINSIRKATELDCERVQHLAKPPGSVSSPNRLLIYPDKMVVVIGRKSFLKNSFGKVFCRIDDGALGG